MTGPFGIEPSESIHQRQPGGDRRVVSGVDLALADRVPRHFLAWQMVALIPGLTFLAWLITSPALLLDGVRFTLFDDAMISMTYARTLAESGEWVWFPGAERVQGFTNPLWTLIMAGIHLLGFEGSSAALVVSLLGALIVVGVALVVGRLAFASLPDVPYRTIWAASATGAVPLMFPFAFWTIRGMEVGLLGLCAIAMVWASVTLVHAHASSDDSRWPAVVLGTAGVVGVLTRLDFIVICVAIAVVSAARTASRRRAFSLIAASVVLPAAACVGILLFQRAYWGSFMPNTYYLKMTGFDSWTRIERGLLADAKLLPTLALLALSQTLIIQRSSSRYATTVSLAATAALATSIAYSTWVGGDAWETFKMANRYVATAVPALALVVFIALATATRDPRPVRSQKVVIALGVVAAAGALLGVTSNPPRIEWGVSAAFLAAFLPVAVFMVLAFPRRLPMPKVRAFTLAVLVVALLIVVTSVPRLPISLRAGFPPDAVSDAEMSQRGIWLNEMTNEDATIATLFAGAPPYYAQRPAIDLLGKSDSYIAQKQPNWVPEGVWNSDFYPGHNKWDLNHSVLVQRPDIVLNFLSWEGEDVALRAAGYEQRCLPDAYPILVLSDSTNVDFSKLSDCP